MPECLRYTPGELNTFATNISSASLARGALTEFLAPARRGWPSDRPVLVIGRMYGM